MSLVMFKQALRDLRWTLFWYALGLTIYAALIISVYPLFSDMMSDFERLIEQYPDAVMQAFGLEGEFTGFAAFVGVEFINVIWPIIVSIFVIMSGTATVAREIEQGTADMWLSVPVERWRLLASKVIALLAGIVILVAVTIISIGVGAAIIGETLSMSRLVATSLVLLSFPVSVLGYAVLLSSLFSERGKAAGIAAGITMLSYLAWLVAGLAERWEWLKYVSTFTPYNPQEALEAGQIYPLQTGILFLVGIAGVIAGLLIFQRRDVATV